MLNIRISYHVQDCSLIYLVGKGGDMKLIHPYDLRTKLVN